MRIALSLLMLCCHAIAQAQHPSEGFNRDPLSPLDHALNQRSHPVFPTVQPASHGLERNFYALSDTSTNTEAYTNGLNVSPLGYVGAGLQFTGSTDALGDLAPGVHLKWHRQDRWSASLGYVFWGRYSNTYTGRLSDSLRVIPGVGRTPVNGDGSYRANYFFGNVGYRAGKFFHFEAGNGKHFWGDGYRSLILSDNAPAFPYFRITTQFWKIKYTNLWAQMRDISVSPDAHPARKKYVAMHALSWNATPSLNFTFFEMVVWQDRDSLSRRTLDMNYLNPVIFFRPVEYAQGSADNELIGFSFKVKASSDIQVYGQLLMDEFLFNELKAGRGWWANKFGTQFGMKFFDAFTPGLGIQTEFNAVRPFTYTHGSPVQAWAHLNQPLAHPLGANFLEWLTLLRYDSGPWKFSEKFIWAAYGRDKDADPDVPGMENYGGNILRSYKGPYRQYGNTILQGLKSTMYYNEVEVTRKLNGSLGLELFVNYVSRFEKNEVQTISDQFLLLGIRSNMMLLPARDF